jgi:hypothetical protein
MWSTVKVNVVRFHRSFHQSGVIWFARIQVLLGAVWAALTAVDLAPVIGNPKYVTAWLVFSGIVTEYSRRSRTCEDEDGHLLPRGNTINVTVDNNAAPAPASPLGPTSGNTK